MMTACIFDVDGVLLDSVQYHFRAWKALFDQLHIPFEYEDYVQKVNGLPRSVGIKNIAKDSTEEECERYASIKQEFLIAMATEKPLSPLPGVVEFLTLLQKNSIPAAAASSSKNAPLFLERAGLTPYLKTVVSGSDFNRPKPDPQLFLIAAERMGVDVTQCVVVEDALSGVQAAQAGGMIAVGLLHSGDKAISEVADLSIHSLVEYPKVLSRYFIKETDA